VEVGGVARAYPLRVLVWHEVVNAASAAAIAVSFSALTGSTLVFDRRVGARELRLAATGNLRARTPCCGTARRSPGGSS
jgi:hypothetical protein